DGIRAGGTEVIMTSRVRGHGRVIAGVFALGLIVAVTPAAAGTHARALRSAQATRATPTATLTVGKARSVTPANNPAGAARSAKQSSPAPLSPIGAKALARAKARAAAQHGSKGSLGLGGANANATSTASHVFAGANQCDGSGTCWFPPDSNAAVGKKQVLEI